jgi:hypothetical protein
VDCALDEPRESTEPLAFAQVGVLELDRGREDKCGCQSPTSPEWRTTRGGVRCKASRGARRAGRVRVGAAERGRSADPRARACSASARRAGRCWSRAPRRTTRGSPRSEAQPTPAPRAPGPSGSAAVRWALRALPRRQRPVRVLSACASAVAGLPRRPSPPVAPMAGIPLAAWDSPCAFAAPRSRADAIARRSLMLSAVRVPGVVCRGRCRPRLRWAVSWSGVDCARRGAGPARAAERLRETARPRPHSTARFLAPVGSGSARAGAGLQQWVRATAGPALVIASWSTIGAERTAAADRRGTRCYPPGRP